MSQDFCDEHQYYVFGIGKPGGHFWGDDHILIKSRHYVRVKKMLIRMLSNLGQPKIALVDANFKNNSELRLVHLHDGRDLCYNGCSNCGGPDLGIKEVLERLYVIWNKEKQVHLETVITEWPKKKPVWFYWNPPGHPLSNKDVEEPKYMWTRYTCNGKSHNKVTRELNRSKLDKLLHKS